MLAAGCGAERSLVACCAVVGLSRFMFSETPLALRLREGVGLPGECLRALSGGSLRSPRVAARSPPQGSGWITTAGGRAKRLAKCLSLFVDKHETKHMMVIRYILALLLLLGSVLEMGGQERQRTQVLVETSKGKFILELFDETPRHRDNFLANVRSGRYEGTFFHRVIKDFMVQGGNTHTKGLAREAPLTDDSEVGTIEAELLPELFIHERGALAAAREGDETNPQRASSATQFYIVTGKYSTEFDLQKEMARRGLHYTPAQMQAYMLRGGAPHLDGGYTVFGRLLDGWKTIDKIQRAETDEGDRPVKNIYIKRMSIYSPKKR